MTIKRNAPGHYTGTRGDARNIKSASGAAHTRCQSNWLVTRTDGKTELVRSLVVAKLLIA